MDGKTPPHPGIYNKQMVSVSNLNFSLYCDFWKMCFDLPTFYLKKLYNWLDLHGSDFDADRLPPPQTLCSSPQPTSPTSIPHTPQK